MKLLRITGLVLMGLIILATQCLAKSPEESYQSFSVEFEQDGKVLKPDGHVIKLQKKDFAIIVTFNGYQGDPVAVGLNSSVNGKYYKIAKQGLQVTDLLADGIGMAEPAEPAKKLILTDTRAIQYLSINGGKARFHEVKTLKNAIVGKRYIADLCYRGGSSFPIQKLPVNEIYLTFIKRSATGFQQEYYIIQFPKPDFPKQQLTDEQWLEQGIKFEQQKDFGLAIEAYGKAIASTPGYYDAYLLRGKACATLGRYDQALTDYNSAIAIRPQDTTAYFWQAAALCAIGSEGRAYEAYSKIIEIDPKNSRAYALRGKLMFNDRTRFSASKERLQTALEDFSKVIELEPNAAAYKQRAEIYYFLSEYEKSLADYNQAIRLEPRNISLYEGRAMVYTALNMSSGIDTLQESWDNVNKIIELDHGNAKAFIRRAVLADKLSRSREEIIADYNKALEIYNSKKYGSDGKVNESVVYVLQERGNYLRHHDRKDAAIADFTVALTIKPNSAFLYHSRGVTYFEKGEYDLAIADCTKAIELSGSSVNSWTYLVRGKAYKAKGMYQEALNDFDTAIKAKPGFEEAIAERDSL